MKTKKTHFHYLILLPMIILLIAPQSQAQVIFKAGFEGGDFQEVSSTHTVAPGSAAVVDNPLKDAGNPTDKVARLRTMDNSERAELRLKPVNDMGEYWYGWSTFIPGKWQAAQSGPKGGGHNIITQWHRGAQTPSWAKGHPMTLSIDEEGTYHINWNYGGPDRVKKGAELPGINVGPDKGHWVHWAFHVKWAMESTGNGFMRLYHNGDLVFSNDGPNMENLEGFMMWKAGIYHGNPSILPQDPYDIYDDNFILAGPKSDIHDVNPYLKSNKAKHD